MAVKKASKIFVLDTSVILFDHSAIFAFDEHDVAIPIPVLEELDHLKKGNENKNFEARQFIRTLDKIAENKDLSKWIKLTNKKKGKISVVFNSNGIKTSAVKIFNEDTKDNRILDTALYLKMKHPNTPVVFVTKDINLRLKAKSLQLTAENFEFGNIKNVDQLPTGVFTYEEFENEEIAALHKSGKIDLTDKNYAFLDPENNYYILKSPEGNSALAYYNTIENALENIQKTTSFGITSRNAEQTFAMHALMNEGKRLVCLQGVAGTGKTLLALSSAMEIRSKYKQIFLARPVVALGNKDLGYLPGDINSKLDPFMQPLWDNLKFIQNQFSDRSKEFKLINQMVEMEKLTISALSYIRGRSLSSIIFIVDEAQNLTPHEIKTIITRAGEGAKFIFTGDVKQIDTPYLDEKSNGLAYVIDKFRGQDIFSHIQLIKGERSKLANIANELL